jgi:hypothetical protein
MPVGKDIPDIQFRLYFKDRYVQYRQTANPLTISDDNQTGYCMSQMVSRPRDIEF